MEQKISKKYDTNKLYADDYVFVEAFLRAAKDVLDESLTEYSLDQVRGALLMTEKFLGIREELYKARKSTQDQIKDVK